MFDATINGIPCKGVNYKYYSGLSTKEFTLYFMPESKEIIAIEGLLYGEWFIASDKEEIKFYIENYMPEVNTFIEGETKTC